MQNTYMDNVIYKIIEILSFLFLITASALNDAHCCKVDRYR
jgi:hypothetical protein